MIRKYDLKKPLPMQQLLKIAGEITHYWRQSSDIPVDLKEYFVSQVPAFKTLGKPVIGIHSTYESIPRHRDCNARSAFIFPVRFGKTTRFVVDDHVVAFEPKKIYRFSDYHFHHVDNPFFAHLVLVKVRFE